MHTWFWWGNLKVKRLFEDLGIEGKIILKWILNRIEDMVWIDLDQVRNKGRALVNNVMNIPIP
jgi:hypothetical protein